MIRKCALAFLFADLLVCAPLWAAEKTAVEIWNKTEWIELPASAGNPTRASIRLIRALDPKSKELIDSSYESVACDPKGLRRTFRLDKAKLFLGEPIVVEHRVELKGPGKFREPFGGNYRARGRDDNFLFLMRHEDGSWVADPYGEIQFYMGGLASASEVTAEKPASYWLGVQRYAALKRPGKYDLYCFAAAHNYEVVGQAQAILAGLAPERARDYKVTKDGMLMHKNGKSAWETLTINQRTVAGIESPVLARVPPEVQKRMGHWDKANLADFAHFQIEIQAPSPAQRSAFVEHWTALVVGGIPVWPPARHAAAAEAIRFACQDDFLDLLASWIRDRKNPDYDTYTGLAMRSSPAALDLLLAQPSQAAIGAMRYLRPEALMRSVPVLIEALTDTDPAIRAQAESQLTHLTGHSIQHSWSGYHHQRPSLEEARKMQPAWRQWWANNAAKFMPNELEASKFAK